MRKERGERHTTESSEDATQAKTCVALVCFLHTKTTVGAQSQTKVETKESSSVIQVLSRARSGWLALPLLWLNTAP
eukprot:3347082-Rhodomonas_salina.1